MPEKEIIVTDKELNLCEGKEAQEKFKEAMDSISRARGYKRITPKSGNTPTVDIQPEP